MNASLLEIAELVDGKVIGENTVLITSLAPIDNIVEGALVFADSEANFNIINNSKAYAILANETCIPGVKPIIQVKHPFKAFIKLLNYFYPPLKSKPGIHPTAVIAEDCIMGENVSIGAFTYIGSGVEIGNNCIIKNHVSIGANVKIGSNTLLYPHVTLYEGTQLGSGVIIHASSVIGSDGFGYTFIDNEHLKVPHVGHVLIGDNVEIGANTVVDRATLGATVIGEGTKIDNLVQIAHSVKLGKHNILCALTGIAGSTTSGDNVIFAANVGVSDHVTIEDGVILAARAGVPPRKHLKKGNIYLGNPARPKDKAIEQELSVTRIPLMRRNLKTLNETVLELRKRFEQYEINNE